MAPHDLEQQLATALAERDEARNHRAALSLTVSDLCGSLRDAAHKGKGHVCDYRSVCDSLRDKIKGHRERHELTVAAFASMNDREAMAKVKAQLTAAESERDALRKAGDDLYDQLQKAVPDMESIRQMDEADDYLAAWKTATSALKGAE